MIAITLNHPPLGAYCSTRFDRREYCRAVAQRPRGESAQAVRQVARCGPSAGGWRSPDARGARLARAAALLVRGVPALEVTNFYILPPLRRRPHLLLYGLAVGTPMRSCGLSTPLLGWAGRWAPDSYLIRTRCTAPSRMDWRDVPWSCSNITPQRNARCEHNNTTRQQRQSQRHALHNNR